MSHLLPFSSALSLIGGYINGYGPREEKATVFLRFFFLSCYNTREMIA